MKRSLNEIAGMIHKAARGAGLPLGHCDDLAAAGARLVAQGGDAAQITQALSEETGVAMSGPIAIDAVLVKDDDVRMRDVSTPDLMLAMVAARRVDVTGKLDGDDIVLCPGTQARDPVTGPAVVPDKDWAIWADLAAKTFVPATEESRLGGAGAGLTDND